MADPPPPQPAVDGKPSAADAQPKFLNSAKPAPEALWWSRRAWDLLSRLRARAPLVQCITNFVSMDLMANTLLALGASPAMVHSIHEVTDFTPRVDALLVNVGTLTDTWLPSMRAAAVAAMAAGRPWILDPVAVSVSEFRMKACLGLLDLRPAVIRGNASEVLALSAACRLADSKGADSSHDSVDAGEAARSLARKSGAIVAVSGAVDFVTDGHRVVGARNGVAMMQKITATGCSVTAVIAAFVAMDPANAFEATACALSIYGLAGELGMEMAKGPASLRMHMIDSLHGLDEQTVTSRVSIVQFAMQSSSQSSQPTQPSQTPSQQESGIRRRGGNFTTEEDVHLVSAWLNTPYDSVLQGNDLKHKTYWSRVTEFYHKYKNFQSDRNENSLMNRWSQIQIATHRFCQCFAQIEASAPTHMSGEDKVSPRSPQLTGQSERKSRGVGFSPQEDILLVTAWLNTSLDDSQGNEQFRTYWGRVWQYFHQYKSFTSDRNERSLLQRFGNIQLATNKFCGCLAQVENTHHGGANEQLKLINAKQLYQKLYKKKFLYDHCWNLLRRHPKWLDLIRKKNPKSEGKSGSSSQSVSSPSSEGTPINLVDDDAPTSHFVNLERPSGKQQDDTPTSRYVDLETSSEKKSEKRKMKERENSSTSVAIVDLSQETKDEKGPFHGKDTELLEKRLELDKERLRLERIKEEERIMLMDISGMNSDLREYYSGLRKDILRRGKGGS